MDAQVIEILNELGVKGVWALVFYKVFDLAELITVFCLLGWGIKKGWPHVRDFLRDV